MANQFVKNLEKFKLITFDVTNTLLKFKRHPGDVYAECASSLGYKNIKSDQIVNHFSSNFKQMENDYPNFGRNHMEWDTWWQMLIHKIFTSAGTGLSEKDTYRIADVLIDKYETDEYWEKDEKSVEFIERLKASGKKVGIISNFDPRLKYVIENVKLPKFDFVISSYEAGLSKPNPKIFDLAVKLARYDAMPNESLHIGDNPKLDYIGARNALWTSVLITKTNDWMNFKDKINVNLVFQSLDEFINKLENENFEWDTEEEDFT